MAYSFTLHKKTVHGDQACVEGLVTADAASGVVSFGLGTITHLQWSEASMSTALLKVRRNATAAGVESAGDVGISGSASGDEIYLVVWGR